MLAKRLLQPTEAPQDGACVGKSTRAQICALAKSLPFAEWWHEIDTLNTETERHRGFVVRMKLKKHTKSITVNDTMNDIRRTASNITGKIEIQKTETLYLSEFRNSLVGVPGQLYIKIGKIGYNWI